jgi:hypothetical protein
VAYVIPHGIFYIVPVSDIPASGTIRLYPEGSQAFEGRMEHYREAWHLLGV